jgi:DNA-binding PadR family transcriptional regulator
MFHHHRHRDYEERMRTRWDRHARFYDHAARRGRGRYGRILEHGDLRFVVLALIADQPRHGYDLIKALEEKSGGAYRPSAGVIYPTLNLLEDEGLIRPTDGEEGRKLYEITPDGRVQLEGNRRVVEIVFGRLEEAAENSSASRPRIGRAMANLGMALQARLSRRPITPEEIDRIVAMIDDTAAAIEKS